jgi:hypothetical protein
MPKTAVLRLLLLLGCSLVFLAPAQAQYTIHDSQLEAAGNWLINSITKVLCLGVGAPLLLSWLTSWFLHLAYPYHTATITLSLWLSCLIWWIGFLLAYANDATGPWTTTLLVFLTIGASALGYSVNRKLKPD